MTPANTYLFLLGVPSAIDNAIAAFPDLALRLISLLVENVDVAELEIHHRP